MAASASPSPPPPPGSGSPPVIPERPDPEMILNFIDQGFCVLEMIFDPEGRPADYRFLQVNPAFEQQTGFVGAAGRRARELVPDLEDHWFEIYSRVARTGEPTRFVGEAHVLHPRWFDAYAFRVGDPKQHRVAVLFTDITARIRLERATRVLSDVSEALVELAHESDLPGIIRTRAGPFFRLSQCAFVELDLERRLGTVNSSWNDPGAPPVAGTHRAADFVSESLWQEAVAGRTVAITDVAADERVPGHERFAALHVRSFLSIPLRRRESYRHLLMLARAEPAPWRDDEIELARELAARCWTRVERLRTELALKTSEESLRLILENAREYAILTMDTERRVTTWSEGAERLLGYCPAEILGQSADLIFTPEDVAAGAPAQEAVIALHEGRASDERWHLRKDGTRFWGSGAMMALHDADGRVQGLLKIMRDQTSVRLAQEALVRSQTELQDALQLAQEAGAAKDRFLAALSHELRTPLNPVLMIAEERAADPTLPAGLREDFEMIQRNIEHEARLIDDMLDLNRIARGKLSLQLADVDLHTVLQEVLHMVRSAGREKRIKVSSRLTSARAVVRGDPARMRQVFLNLLNNAIKFTPMDGAVTVTSRISEDAQSVVIEVSDTGLGMTEDELARAFDAFAQGSHATAALGSRSFGGLGLGLAIVRDLVERHGGRAEARSRGRGHGATFTVTLPLAPDAPARPT